MIGHTAYMLEAKRVRERYDLALENIDWLSAQKPTWACGTPLARSEVDTLLQVNRNVVEFTERHCSEHLKATTRLPSASNHHIHLMHT